MDYITPSLTSAGTSAETSSSNLKPRRRTSGPVFVQIAEDPEDETNSEPLAERAPLSNELIAPVPEPEFEIAAIDKENAAPDEGYGKENSVISAKQKCKPKKRRSIGQQSGRRKRRLSKASVQSTTEQPPQDDATPEPAGEEPEWETVIGDDSSLAPEQISKPTTVNNTVGKKRRKRKSVVLKPRRRRSGESTARNVVNPSEVPHDIDTSIRDPINPNPLAAPTPSIQLDSAARRRLSEAYNVESPRDGPTYEPEIGGDETYIDQESPEKPTPKARSQKATKKGRKGRRSGSNAQSSSSGTANASSRVEKSSKSTFPILTHRMTNISALPTIAEDDEDNQDLSCDLNSTKTKFTDRSTPNAIDVLAQICRETIANTISKLSTSTGTRELKRKRTALEAFSSEIDSRLFDMSVAIEHRLTMEGRVKKAKRAKTEAQNEWMAIRRAREEIALKCDAIRAQNQKMEAEGKETYELSERLHELEMLVEKPEVEGEGGASEGLEYLLRSVAMTVSGSVGAGEGLLAQVKRFNRQLERTALVLEGRELD